MPDPTFVQGAAVTGGVAFDADKTFSLPAPAAAGSLLVLAVTVHNGLNLPPTLTLPAGWWEVHAPHTLGGVYTNPTLWIIARTAQAGDQSVTIHNYGDSWQDTASYLAEYAGMLNSGALDGPGGVLDTPSAPGTAFSPTVTYSLGGPRLILHCLAVTSGGGAAGTPGVQTPIGPTCTLRAAVNSLQRLYFADALTTGGAAGGSSQCQYLNTAVHPAAAISHPFREAAQATNPLPRRFW